MTTDAQITVNWQVNIAEGECTVWSSDLGYDQDAWEAMSNIEKRKALQEYVDNNIDVPCMCVERWTHL